MIRCELHSEGPLANRCDLEAVVTIQVVVSAGLEARAEFTAAACAVHVWEAAARGAHEVIRLRGEDHDDARMLALVERAGSELLGLHDLLQGGVEVGHRWPLAKPWSAK